MPAVTKRHITTIFIAILTILITYTLKIDAAAPETADLQSASQVTTFPVGKQTLKITINQAGIYQLTANDLANAGMAAIDPTTIEMMWQGQPIAYQFVGDNDTEFETGEAIQFYGWAFDGSRHDKLFVGANNVFWLWADGTPTFASSINNDSGGIAITEWRSVVEKADANFFSTGATLYNVSSTHDNEPDAWFLLGLTNHVTETVSVELPNPVAAGSDASLLVEVSNLSDANDHNFSVALNNTTQIVATWHGLKNQNLVKHDVDHTLLINGANSFNIATHHTNFSNDMLVKRIRVEYDRNLTALNDTLQFNYAMAGKHTFQVNGFVEDSAANFVAWDVTDRTAPTVVKIATADITLASGNNTLNLTLNHPADSDFLITTASNLLVPAELATYTASSLEPATGSAEWVAIAHNTLLTDTADLAQHRANFSNLSTHVVDVQDVYNQYGYGLATPAALQAFFTHTLSQWGMKYGVLVGDATENPLGRDCISSRSPDGPHCSATWSTSEVNLVLTDFQFKDRFVGMIATDHTLATVVDNDELEDFAIGRLPARTSTDLQNIVAKIKKFELDLRAGAAWTNTMVWYADATSLGGDFCTQNTLIRDNYIIDGTIVHKELCLTENTPAAVVTARTEFLNFINSTGARIINYNGQGSTTTWGRGLMTIDATWANSDKPSIILSIAGLDGNFTQSGQVALSESLLTRANSGSVAYWASSGIGYSVENTQLHTEFYTALYQHDKTQIGDAVFYSKNAYISNSVGDISQPYSFNLQADPAMHITYQWDYQTFLPMIMK